MEHPQKTETETAPVRKVWQDPELSVLAIDETLSTVPPGTDGNGVGS